MGERQADKPLDTGLAYTVIVVDPLTATDASRTKWRRLPLMAQTRAAVTRGMP